MLEPVLDLARLDIRANQTDQAFALLEGMYQAIIQRTDLIVEDHTLPLADLTGTQQDRRALRRWAWLVSLSEGIRALTARQSWQQAADHARRHNGIGQHIMEGRQAAIIAHAMNGERTIAQALLANSTITEPWENLMAVCLRALCSAGAPESRDTAAAAMIREFESY